MKKIKNLGIKLDILGIILLLSAIIFSVFSKKNTGIFSWQAIIFLLLCVIAFIIIKEISPRVKKKTGEKIFKSTGEIIQHYWPAWYKKYLHFKAK